MSDKDMEEMKNTELSEKKVSKSKANKEKEPSFEEALTRLQEIANLLENSNPPLDTALTLYEEKFGREKALELVGDMTFKEYPTTDEYLINLRDNYPGTETDIFKMIDDRLNNK